jgi:hypothetical protein
MTPAFNALQLTDIRPSATAENLAEPTERRELAHRVADGIEVTLFWSKPTNATSVEVLDTRSGNRLAFGVRNHAALDAFRHPYAYA